MAASPDAFQISELVGCSVLSRLSGTISRLHPNHRAAHHDFGVKRSVSLEVDARPLNHFIHLSAPKVSPCQS